MNEPIENAKMKHRQRKTPNVSGAPPVKVHSIAGWALGLSVLAWLATYVWLYLHGIRFFVMKTAVMPIFLLYAVFLRERLLFITDWLPFLAGTVLFDAIRGAIFSVITARQLHIFVNYVRWAEAHVFGVPAVPVVLQAARSPVLDTIAVAIHASHFAYFLVFGLILWHVDRRRFLGLRNALFVVMGLGLLIYGIVPTAPPWLAFERFHELPPVLHIAGQIYTGRLPELYGTFDTNPVAAMPSLHVAFPLTCALVGWQAYGRRVGACLVLYAATVAMAVMYLGEHYAVDVLAGMVTSVAAVHATRSLSTQASSTRGAILASVMLVAMTAIVLHLT